MTKYFMLDRPVLWKKELKWAESTGPVTGFFCWVVVRFD